MFSLVWQKLKELIARMIGSRTIEQKLHVTPVISAKMEDAIELWSDMYKDQSPWLHEPSYKDSSRVTSLGLASAIASEKARTALIEFQSEITTPSKDVEVKNPNYKEPDEFGNVLPSSEPEMITESTPLTNTERAKFLNKEYKKLKKELRTQLEYGIAKGGLVIKPYVVINNVNEEGSSPSAELEFDFIQADCFYPMSFDDSKRITEAAFIQTKVEKDIVYRRLEYHKYEGNKAIILNSAFMSSNKYTDETMTALDLGKEIPLTDVPEWASLQPKTVIENVDRPLFAYFKMPQANTIDPTSPLGVSGFSRAVNLIKDADMQYSRLLWEYEGGEMAIDIDRDAFSEEEDAHGHIHTVMNKLQQRLFRKVDLGDDSTYQPFAPALRDSSYISGLNTILMKVEDAVCLSRGTLSDMNDTARTATELRILKQRSYQANADIQVAIQDALTDVVYIMNVYCDLYGLTPDGDYDVSFEWDDSILVDVNEELEKRLILFQNKLTSRVELRMWYFGETERQAVEALQKIDEESLQEMQDNLAMYANQANIDTQSKIQQQNQQNPQNQQKHMQKQIRDTEKANTRQNNNNSEGVN